MTRQDQENREIGKQGNRETGNRGTQRNHGKTGGME